MPIHPLLKRMPQALVLSTSAHALLVLSALTLVDERAEPSMQASHRAASRLAVELQSPQQTTTAPVARAQPERPRQQKAPSEKAAPVQAMPKQEAASTLPAAAVQTVTEASSAAKAPPRPTAEAQLPPHGRQEPPTDEPRPVASAPIDKPSNLTATVTSPATQREPELTQQTITEYQRSLQALLEKSKHYPRQARLRRMEDEIVVSFTINEAGGLETCTLVSSAGFALLDDAALAAVRNAAPFPAPPAGMIEAGGKPVTFEVPILFSIRS